MCYDRVNYPLLICNNMIPKFLPQNYANGQCPKCGPLTIDLLSCPVLNSHKQLINYNKQYHAPQSGINSSGAQNTQLELGSFRYTINTILTK